MNPLLAALEGLTHNDWRERDLAVEHLGDLLRGAALDHADVDLAVTRLVALLTTETDPTVQEAALHAIAEAFDHHQLGLQLFEPLTPRVPTMAPAMLEFALYILAATHDPKARPTIEAFIDHPDPAVRGYATDALTELPGRLDQ
jgi:HEAT repeat protein